MSNRGPRGRKKMNLDLNAIPPKESQDQAGTSNVGHLEVPIAQPALIDVDAINDDDVIISTPTGFAEAKRKAGRIPSRALVHDLESGEEAHVILNNRKKVRKVQANQTTTNCDLFINLEGSKNSTGKGVVASHVNVQTSPPMNNLTYSCPICMGSLVEEVSTKCGHIFCKRCITAAISVQPRCPTCRKRMTIKNIMRVYLPISN